MISPVQPTKKGKEINKRMQIKEENFLQTWNPMTWKKKRISYRIGSQQLEPKRDRERKKKDEKKKKKSKNKKEEIRKKNSEIFPCTRKQSWHF